MKLQIEGLREEYTERVTPKPLKKSTLDIIKDQRNLEDQKDLFKKLLDDTNLKNKLKSIVQGIESYNSASHYAPSDIVAKLKANKIIVRNENNKDSFTDLGNAFLKYYYDNI